MRVIMYPAVGVQNENRYIDILVGALRSKGVEVIGWSKHLSFQSGDVFHVHWPEIIPEIRDRKNNMLRGEWIALQFFSTIRRVKRQGGRIAWTVHDLAPHDAKLRRSPFLEKFMARFMAQVDVALSLTQAGIAQIRTQLPALSHAQCFVTHHPHYRSVLNTIHTDRAQTGAKPEQRIFSFLGSLRANKRPDLVMQAFRGLPTDSNFLIMAGGASAEVTAEVTKLAHGASNLKLDLRRIPEAEMSALYSVSDILVFPGTDYFNSGTIYTALSLNVPVLAAWSPTNTEIQQAVGKEWLHLYEGDFTTAAMQDAAQALISRKTGAVCNLTVFEPAACADEHIVAYSAPLERAQRADHAA